MKLMTRVFKRLGVLGTSMMAMMFSMFASMEAFAVNAACSITGGICDKFTTVDFMKDITDLQWYIILALVGISIMILGYLKFRSVSNRG